MSSSRRKSRAARDLDILPECVMCGSWRIQRKKISVRLRNGRSVTVEAEVCEACGERYYGPEAMQRLEAAAKPRAKSAA